MNEPLRIKLKDDFIVAVDSGDEWYRGCDTCDYGSAYINTLSIYTTTKEITVEVSKMYNFAFSVSHAILMFASAELADVAQEELGNWIEEKIRGFGDPILADLEKLTFKHHIRDREVKYNG